MLKPAQYEEILKVEAEYQKTRATFDEVTLNRVKEILRWENECLGTDHDIEGTPGTEYQYELSYFETGVQLSVKRIQYVKVTEDFYFFSKERLFSDEWQEEYLSQLKMLIGF